MRAAILSVAVLAVVAGSASAHHSHPVFYDACTTLTIAGAVESVEWKNPHVLVDITTAEGKAYRAEWNSAGALERDAIAPPKVGDLVVVTGNPMRDPAAIRARFPSLELTTPSKPVVDLIRISRASDNWAWSRPEPSAPADCGRR